MEGTQDLAAVQARLRRFRDERDWAQFHGPGNLAKAISVEAAVIDAVNRKIARNAEKYPVAAWKGKAGKASGA